MLKDSKVVVIPEWLQNSLKLLDKPLSIAFDFVELSKVLTQQDLAFYVFLNRVVYQSGDKLLAPFVETLNFPDFIKSYGFGNGIGISPHDSEYSSTFQKINDLVQAVPVLYGKESDSSRNYIGNMSELPVWIKAGLLNGPMLSGVEYSNSNVFELIPIGDKLFGLKLLYADSQTPFSKQYFGSIDNSIGHLHQYYGFDDIAGTKLFRVFADYASSSNV